MSELHPERLNYYIATGHTSPDGPRQYHFLQVYNYAQYDTSKYTLGFSYLTDVEEHKPINVHIEPSECPRETFQDTITLHNERVLNASHTIGEQPYDGGTETHISTTKFAQRKHGIEFTTLSHEYPAASLTLSPNQTSHLQQLLLRDPPADTLDRENNDVILPDGTVVVCSNEKLTGKYSETIDDILCTTAIDS